MNLKNKAQALLSLGLVPCKATNRAMLGFKLHPIVAYCCNLFSLDILHSIAPNCILHMLVHSCCGKQIQRFTLRWKCGSAHYRIRWGGGWSIVIRIFILVLTLIHPKIVDLAALKTIIVCLLLRLATSPTSMDAITMPIQDARFRLPDEDWLAGVLSATATAWTAASGIRSIRGKLRQLRGGGYIGRSLLRVIFVVFRATCRTVISKGVVTLVTLLVKRSTKCLR